MIIIPLLHSTLGTKFYSLKIRCWGTEMIPLACKYTLNKAVLVKLKR